MAKLVTVIILGLPLLLLLEITPTYWQAAKIIEVLDGDTVKFTLGKKLYTGRILFIDAPEKDQPQGKLSSQFLKQEIEKKSVLVRREGTDIYGRQLIHLKHNSKLISLDLIERGLVVLYPFSFFSSSLEKRTFLKAQLRARKFHMGIWKSSFVNPYHWRKCRQKLTLVGCNNRFERSLKWGPSTSAPASRRHTVHPGHIKSPVRRRGFMKDPFLVKNFDPEFSTSGLTGLLHLSV